MMGAIRELNANVRFLGVGGPQMLEQGLEPLVDIEKLSMNGFVEPLKRLPSLVRTLLLLVREFRSVDVVVGVDFNVFNLLLERLMKKRGVPTVHYVSPSVYAWRRGRVKKIARATDVMMTLFPFEPELYKAAGIRAEFVGHSTADLYDPKISKTELRNQARNELKLEQDHTVVTIMPGSRRSEIAFHLPVFLTAARRFQESQIAYPITFLIPYIQPRTKSVIEEHLEGFRDLDCRLLNNTAWTALAASDVALIKSGTGTLEALFAKTPMVVAYVIGEMTFRFVRSLMYTDLVALPNILHGDKLVPEFLQKAATPENLTRALISEYERSRTSDELSKRFSEIHVDLKRNASLSAARTVLSVIS